MPRDKKSQTPLEEVSYRWLFWVLATLTAASTIWVVWDEAVTRRPWKVYQDGFNQVLADRGMAAEAIHVHQINNPDLDLVDRCHTCHRAIDTAGFESEDIPLVFRTHPERKTLLGKYHPVDSVGCTTCHRGQGAQIKGVSWWSFDHGRNDPYWDEPMLTGAFVESTCVGCHEQEDPVPKATTFNRGRRLFEDLRCFGCHTSPLVTPDYPPAPSFDHLTSKTSPAFITAWLESPADFRPGTRMPRFWPAPVDPATGEAFAEDTEQVEQAHAMRDREIAAIVAFIGSIEPRTPLPAVPVPDDADDPALIASGEQLFDQVGCRGCHTVDGPDQTGVAAEERFGPNLSRVGEKASGRWLAAWLNDPTAVSPGTRMPTLRLTDEERDALVAFLVTRRADDASAVRADWPQVDPALADEGREAIQKYGCYGCHDIPGFEGAGQAGAPLDDFGDKTADRLAWGNARVDCDRPALECWTMTKLESPRRFSGTNMTPLMPDMGLSEDDALALSVFMLSHRKKRMPEDYRRTLSPTEQAVQDGERLITRRNCRGCHEIGRFVKVIVDEDYELEAIEYAPIGASNRRFYDHPSSAPPPLTFAGQKFQYPWLYDFLSAPRQIRPWLVARMPMFPLTAEHENTLIRYFAARADQPFPFRPSGRPSFAADERPVAVELFTEFQCSRCHEVGAATQLQQGELAPPLTAAAERLRPEWMRKWLLDPQTMQPGTKMPTFFPLEDDDDPTSFYTPFADKLDGDVMRQVDALVAVVIELGAVALGPPATTDSEEPSTQPADGSPLDGSPVE